MKRILTVCFLVLCLLLTACTATTGGQENEKGGVEMTEMVKRALVLAGVSSDAIEKGELKVSEKTLAESAAFLETALTAKYPGVEFEMTACVPYSFGQSQDEYVLQPAGVPEAEFTAKVTAGDEMKLTDSYYGVIKRADYEAYIKEIIGAIEPGAQVISTIDYQFDAEWTADRPIAEAAADSGMFAYTWVLLAPDAEDIGDRAAKVEKLLKDAGMRGDYGVYLMAEGVGELTREEALADIPEGKNDVYTELVRFIVE